MANLNMNDIRAKLLAKENKAQGGNKSFGDNAMYPFWNVPEGSQAVIRFLPDGDPSNDFFWVERLVINLPFQGVVGGDMTKEVKVTVPCMEMYGETCPILSETRAWWKDPELAEVARVYWKKKSYIFQGFVVNSPFNEERAPENPIRRFAINPSIFEIIKSSLMNTEIEDLPTDYELGRDFKLIKTKKGEYANYSTSQWSMKTRALNADELQAVETHGLFTLKDFLPKKPTAEEVAIIKEMFKASVDGEAYDASRWGNYYKPAGFSRNDGDSLPAATETRSAAPSRALNVDDDVPATPAKSGPADALAALKARTLTSAPAAAEEVEEDTGSAGGKPDATEILRRIRERQGR
jgi:hypothetical protein